jgi:hypothetical protein
MDDNAFLTAFEAGAIPNTAFRHHDHLRLAWLYLRRDGRELGGARIRAGLRRFAMAHGVPHLYHETLTSFWIRLVAHAVETFPAQQRFEELLGCWAGFEDRRAAYRHWRPETLDGAQARCEWVEPDLRPLP